MAVTVQDVRDRAFAFLESLKRVSPRERDQMPTPQYAKQYNTLLELAKEVAPNVDPRLFPPPVQISADSSDSSSTTVAARYLEIETYVSIIIDCVPSPPQRVTLTR